MKLRILTKGALAAILLFSVGASSAEEPNDKAARYHALLLKKPGNAMVFGRFVDAWLDTGSKDGLAEWLVGEAKDGGAANWRVLGALHQYLGEDEEALKALNEAVKLDGENADLRLARAKMQARLLAFEAALLDLEVAAKDEKTAIEASKLKGVYLARSGQVEAAVAAWKEVIAAYPKDEDLREDLIEVEVMEGLYKDAIEAAIGLVEMTKDPYQKTLRRLRLGDIQILAGDRKAGLKTYEDILAATGEGTWLEREVLAQVERVFLKEDDIKGLRDFYQKLREEYPRRVSIRKVLARQMALNDEIKEAIALFREVLKITPGDLGNREEFIAFLESNEKWKEAKEELVAMLEQRKEDALLWERLSRIEAKLNDQEGLQRSLAKVAELRKGDAEGLLAAAALYEQAKLAAGAEALLREGRTTFPESLEVAEGLASFLVQNEKEEEALEIWKTMAEGADREGLLRVARSLNSHGKGAVAFKILEARVGDFENDPLILTQYCKLASSVEEATKAIPRGLALVDSSSTPTELETSVQTALRLIARAEKKEETKEQLISKEDLSVTGKCLLAALFADQGDTRKADEILVKAAAAPEGSLARFYRVRFEENRGNLEQAIVILREIIATPEGRKTVHLRRLVDLLERSGDSEKALASVEDWKRIAPGDHAAWTRRARLLQANGQPEEAVVELRRMIGKFGADEERRAVLATALIEAAEYTPAQRIYEQLYSEAERLESKLKWAGEMAQLAEREGKLEELLEDFDRRKRSNPRSVAPLLAIAEIHRVLDQYEERRSALLEASRRRPEDTKLLARIAEVEERAGEFQRAVGILRDAVKRDKTPESKRLLAALLLKNGEVQSGLDLLAEIPGTVNNPRGLEGIVQALVSAQENEQALKFLDKHIARHAGDWRLDYLKAVILKIDGENEQALERFTALLKGGPEIAGLKPLVAANAPNQMGPWKALFGANGWEELTPYQPFLMSQNSRGQGQAPPRISLPGTPRELQLLSVLQGAGLLQELPEKKALEARKALSLPGIRDVDVLASMMSNGGPESMGLLQKRAKENPENLGLFALSLVYKAFQGGITGEEFAKAEKVLLKEYPETFTMIAFSALQSPEVTVEQVVSALKSSLEGLAQDQADEMMQTMAFYALSGYGMGDDNGKDMNPLKDLMAEHALATVEVPRNWGWMSMVVPHLLTEEKGEEALTLINRLCQWQAEAKVPQAAGGMMGMVVSYSGSQRGSRYLKAPAFPPAELKGVPGNFRSLFPVSKKKADSGEDEEAKLLAQLQLEGRNSKVVVPGKVLEGQIDKIQNVSLRALAYLSLEKKEEAQKLIEEMAASRDESDLLFAAGYFHDNDDPRVYEMLLKLRMLPLSRDLRKTVDGHLAFVGSALAEKNEEAESKIDLEPAKRAALRLRRVASVNEREALGEVLVKLGLEKEADRLATAPKPSVARSGSTRMIPSIRSSNQQGRIAQLAKDGNFDGAAREAAKQLRRLLAQGNNDYEIGELVEQLNSKELKEATLEKMDPGESESTRRILDFAQAQQLFGSKEKARALYEKVLAKDPDSIAGLIGVAQTTPFAELDQDRLIVRKGKGDEAEIDVEASGEIFYQLWEAGEKAQDLDQYVSLCALTVSFLETLPPSDEASRNLSWVPYQILDFAGDDSVGQISMDSLIDDGNGYSRNRERADQEATKKRNEAAKSVFLAMIKHPQIAEQGFMLLESGREALELKEEDLMTFAREAAVKMVEVPVGNSFFGGRNLWSRRSGNHSSSSGELANARSPLIWLMAYAAKTDSEVLTPELEEKFREARPEKFALLDQARMLSKAEPAAAEKIYAEWKEGLPEIKRQKAVEFAKQVLLFTPSPGPWTDDLEQLMFAGGEGQSGNGFFRSQDEDFARLVTEWGAWRFRMSGGEKYEVYLTRLFEDGFGPQDKWGILAKLGRNSLPQAYRQSGYAFREVAEKLFAEPDLVKPTLIFVAQHPLEQFIYGFDDEIREAWAPNYTSPKAALATLKANKLLLPEAGLEKSSARQFLMVAEGVDGIRFSNSNRSKGELAELILKEEGFDEVLQKVAAASLSDPDKAREVILPIMEENMALLREMVALDSERSFQLLSRWFPKMEESEVSAPMREFFASFAVKARADRLGVMRKWLEKGIPGIAEKDDDEFWKEFVAFVPLDEKLAGEVLNKVLTEVRLAKSNSRSSSNGVYMTKHDRWLESFLRFCQQGESGLTLAQQVRLIDAAYRGEAGDYALEPRVLGGYRADWMWPLLVKVEKSGGEALGKWLDKLNEGEQATLAVMLANRLFSRPDDDFKRMAAKAAKLREHAPTVADVLEMTAGYHRWKGEKKSDGQVVAREKYLALLSNEVLPIAMKSELLGWVGRAAPELNQDAEIFAIISKTMKEFSATERNVAASGLNTLVGNLAKLDLKEMAEASGELAKLAKEILLSKKALAMRREKDQPPVATGIIKLALKGSEVELAAGLLRKDYAAYRGNLEVMTSLASAGEFEVMRKLIAAHAGIYDAKGLGFYDEEFHQLATQAITEVPEENRYHLEVMLSDLRDPGKENGTPHHSPRGPRMEALAKAFAERGTHLKSAARMQVLGIFAYHGASAPHLEKELRAVAEKMSLEKSFDFKRNSSRLNKSPGYEIVRRVIRMDIAAGNIEPVRAKLREFQKAVDGGSNNNWQLRYQVDQVFGMVGQELIQAAVKSKEAAQETILHAKVIFDIAADLKTDESALRSLNGAGLIVHALAGKGVEWGDYLESHPKSERFEKAARISGRDSLFENLVTGPWTRGESAEIRPLVLRALLDDPFYQKEHLTHVFEFYGLSDSGLFKKEEVIAGVEALPKDHPVKALAMFHVAALKTYKIKGRTAEKGIAAYTEALELARELGKDVLANQILAHRCDAFYRHDRKEAAKSDAPLLKIDELPERDREWVTKARDEKWLK